MSRLAKPTRLWIALGSVVALYVLGRSLGLETWLGHDRLRIIVSDAGAWGPLAFGALFVTGVLAQVPGLVFVSAAPVLFEPVQAWLLCLIAGNVAVNANFAMVRRLGGQPIDGFEKPWMRKAFAQLDRSPVRSVFLLRTVMIMFPPLTGALALTQLDARQHAAGSALGLTLPVSAIVWVEALILWSAQ